MKTFLKATAFAICALILLLMAVVVFGPKPAPQPELTDAQKLAQHDLSIEKECRQQVHVSAECQATLDRLDFIRAVNKSK
jgi:hypothetical protein